MKGITLGVCLCLLLGSSIATAEDKPEPINVTKELPLRVRGMLIREMNEILNGTFTILNAMVRGQHDIVAENAQAIHDSFILKKEMTPEDKKALLSVVPEDFVKQDRAFHALGAQLAEAARKKDKVLQQKLFSDLISSCVNCHTQYAGKRFSGLNERQKPE